jgi:hypothetical protein
MDTNQVSELKLLSGKLGNFNVFIGTPKLSWTEDCAIDEFRDPSEAEALGGSKVLLEEERLLVSEHEVTKFHKTVQQVITMEAVQKNANIFLNFNPNESEVHINEIFIIRQRGIIVFKVFNISVCISIRVGLATFFMTRHRNIS